MKLQFIPVETESQIHLLASMADKVWHEFFSGIITVEQVDYMVERFQSETALTRQIDVDGYEYFFLELNGINIGYFGVHVEADAKKLFLSKLYLLKSYRGKGYATQAFQFLEGVAMGFHLKSIYLTVNRGNTHSVDVYKNWGFVTVKEEATDIGNGFVMDDYIMEYTL